MESVVNTGFDTGLRLESVVNSEFEAIEGIFGGGRKCCYCWSVGEG